MALIVVAFMLVCTGIWDKTFLANAQTCVDESRFKEQVLHVKGPGPPHRLNCPLEPQSDPQAKLTWQKDCQLLTQEGKDYLEFAHLSRQDEGNYTCRQQGNSTASFTVHLIVLEIIACHFGTVRSGVGPNHAYAVIAAIVLILLLAVAAVVYSRCHLNIKLWYRNSYGPLELNDGKLYDAYISYVNNDHDRKFVNFILKPHLENKNAHKVHLNDNTILPGSEPSAELLMNISRSRRLIVLLSHAYLEQDWCSNNFRQGLLHMLELCQQPILIMLEGQSKRMRPEIKQLLTEHQHCLTILTWKHNSVTPSSVFWKELALAMPRRVVFRSESAGDPQTLLHNDKDPMLTLDSDYQDSRSDTDPAGDLGLRLPVYKALAFKAPVLPAAPITAAEPKSCDIDVSDLGSRNYGARSDFYCLVTEEDM